MQEELSRAAILQSSTGPIDLEQAKSGGHQIIDVRSAEEYLAGSIPGALNIPLFDADERSVIGTLYRHGGQEQAVDKGFSYAQKKLTELFSAFRPLSLTKYHCFLRSRRDAFALSGQPAAAIRV